MLVVAVVLVARSDLDPVPPVLSLAGVAVATALIVWVLFDLGGLSLLISQWRPLLERLAATASVAVRALMAPEPGEGMQADALSTPAAPLVRAGVTPAVPPLERSARANMAVALVRVSAMLGGFASLYVVAVALGDSRNREEFPDDELERMRRVMAAWAYYRGALDAGASPSDTYQPTVRRSDSSSGV